jgi:hypothetical protein
MPACWQNAGMAKQSKKTQSSWRSVRMRESGLVRNLRQRHTLWLHGAGIGLIALVVTWGASALQMRLGVDSLALRYLVSLGLGYAAYLLTLRLWAGALLQNQASGVPDLSGLDVSDVPGFSGDSRLPTITTGGGGDFGGGGATADFSHEGSGVTDAMVDLAGGAMGVAADSDDGAVVVVPVVAIFLIGVALVFGAGSLVLLYFGWDVLLAVAVELSFSVAAARATVRVEREGWAFAAVRLTWKPLAGAVLSAVLLGAVIDHFMPTVHSLPQALHLLQAQLR